MSYSVENGNFEGRSRATGAFGNETGQSGRRRDNGAAEAANRRDMALAAAAGAPPGPFKSPVYDATLQNLSRLAQIVGPMIASPGIGLAAPLARSIISGDPYGAFGMPRGWSGYAPRDIDPTGRNPRGNIGGHEPVTPANGSTEARRRAALLALRQQTAASARPARAPAKLPPAYVPGVIGEQVPGLSPYSTATQGYGKAGGYGGIPRPMIGGNDPNAI